MEPVIGVYTQNLLVSVSLVLGWLCSLAHIKRFYKTYALRSEVVKVDMLVGLVAIVILLLGSLAIQAGVDQILVSVIALSILWTSDCLVLMKIADMRFWPVFEARLKHRFFQFIYFLSWLFALGTIIQILY